MLKFVVSNQKVYRKIYRIPIVRNLFVFDVSNLDLIEDEILHTSIVSHLRCGDSVGKETAIDRFKEVDELTIKYLYPGYKFHDVGVSTGVSSLGALEILSAGSSVGHIYLSDKFIVLKYRKFRGTTFICDGSDKLLCAYKFGILIDPTLSKFYFLSRVLFGFISLPSDSLDTHEVTLLDSKILKLIDSRNISTFQHDIFRKSTIEDLSVVRCMNLLNKSYFTTTEIASGLARLIESLAIGGKLIVGRTLPDGVSIASVYEKLSDGMKLLQTLNGGSDIDDIIQAEFVIHAHGDSRFL